ncbi:MAG: hypothetical protein GY698_00025 [Actinomycetia bacterium]|nr:hypothetical protein [Actinomycetes bacterium]
MLEVFVATSGQLARVEGLPTEARVVDLGTGFSLIPITARLRAALGSDGQPQMGFLELTAQLVAMGEALSATGPVAYCHSEFHGGTGLQAAVVWDRGEISFGPLFTANHRAYCESEEYVLIEGRGRIRQMAVNSALRHLGARVGEYGDEFEAVGLTRHRWTEDWFGERNA